MAFGGGARRNPVCDFRAGGEQPAMKTAVMVVVVVVVVGIAMVLMQPSEHEKYLASSAIGLYNHAKWCASGDSKDPNWSGGCFSVGRVIQ